MAKKATTRVQFDMPNASYNRMNVLREKIEATSHAEVIRRALQLYEALVEEAEKGGDIVVRTKEDGETVLRPIF